MSLTLRLDTSGLDTLFARLNEKAAEAVRPAAYAGTRVIYDQVVQNVSRIRSLTGNLKNSIYHVYSKDNSVDGKRATYEISWNYKKAPHGVLVEFGHLVRYKYYQDENGNVRPMVRPEKIGTPPPKRSASRAAKDAYYVTLPAPYKTVPQPFMRNAWTPVVLKRAGDEIRAELIRRFNDALEGR